MSEVFVSETIEDLFKESFGAWEKDITNIHKNTEDEVLVTMKTGKQYLFGRKADGELYLHTVK